MFFSLSLQLPKRSNQNSVGTVPNLNIIVDSEFFMYLKMCLTRSMCQQIGNQITLREHGNFKF